MVLDARGDTVLPGFIDSHTHMFFGGVVAAAIDLSQVTSIDEIVAGLGESAAETPERSMGPRVRVNA